MKVENITKHFKVLSNRGIERNISSMFVSDLLSHALCKAKEGDILITVQNNMNSIAVASLLDLSCIILPDDISIDEDIVKKAIEENIPVLSSDKSAKDIILMLYSLGIK